MGQKCILCGSSGTDRLSQIPVKDICLLYHRCLGINISEEFGSYTEIDYCHCQGCDLKFFVPPVTGSSQFYEGLSNRMECRYYLHEKNEYALAGDVLQDCDTVLDVGSGAGHFRKYVKGDYTGLERNSAAVNAAHKLMVNVKNESLEEHLLQNAGRYSAVTCFQVLEHVAWPQAFIRSCLQAVNPGGLLVISVPSEDSYVSQENAPLNMPPHHVSRWTDRCLRNFPKLFDLKLERFEHEELAEVHAASFAAFFAKQLVRERLGCRRAKVIDFSVRSRLMGRIAFWLTPFCTRFLANSPIYPRGHSVTAVYRKLS
jgi:SAM-dependent methyltransferase